MSTRCATRQMSAISSCCSSGIQRDGVLEVWRRRRKRYLHPGDGRKYWAMTTAVWHARIINRMLVADDLERLRRES